MNEIIAKVYNSHPGGLSSLYRLYTEVKKLNKNVTVEDVKKYLKSDLTYTLHYPARRKWKRNRIIVSQPNELGQADLCDMRNLSDSNSGYKYILTYIDCFSKIGLAKPLMSKTQKEVASALDQLLKEHWVSRLQVDKGKEFANKLCKETAAANGTYLFFTLSSDIKASICERWNRTLKAKMYRYFTLNGTRRYINVLSHFVNDYNRSIHRSIQMRPIDVNEKNAKIVFNRLYPGFETERKLREYISRQDTSKSKFKTGEVVRKRYYLSPMEHRYLPNYSDRYYVVKAVVKGYPNYKYKLVTYEDNSPLQGTFYEEELESVIVNEHRVEVVDRRKRRGREELLLHYIGYPKQFDSWQPASIVRDLREKK